MPQFDQGREVNVTGHYTLSECVDKLREEVFELMDALNDPRLNDSDASVYHLIEEMVDVSILIRRVETKLSEKEDFAKAFKKFCEFKTLRQELRILIGDETYGGKKQKA